MNDGTSGLLTRSPYFLIHVLGCSNRADFSFSPTQPRLLFHPLALSLPRHLFSLGRALSQTRPQQVRQAEVEVKVEQISDLLHLNLYLSPNLPLTLADSFSIQSLLLLPD